MNHHTLTITLFILYLVVMTAIMIWQGIGIAPDRYAFLLILPTLFIKKTRSFLLDWLPFLFILLSYDFLRGFADNVTQRVDYLSLINAELFIFGGLPTAFLQSMLFNPSKLAWYDYFLTVIYFLHFAFPLSFGFILWVKNKHYFRRFVVGLLLMSYAAWMTYIIFPAAPPWMARRDGYITGVTKIIDQTLTAFPAKIDLPTIYQQFNPNPVAPMPSMHAAYPLLILLFALRFFRKKGLVFLPYTLLVWLAIVYLGEHYVTDVIGGAIYALFFFWVAIWGLDHVKFLANLFNRLFKFKEFKEK